MVRNNLLVQNDKNIRKKVHEHKKNILLISRKNSSTMMEFVEELIARIMNAAGDAFHASRLGVAIPDNYFDDRFLFNILFFIMFCCTNDNQYVFSSCSCLSCISCHLNRSGKLFLSMDCCDISYHLLKFVPIILDTLYIYI